MIKEKMKLNKLDLTDIIKEVVENKTKKYFTGDEIWEIKPPSIEEFLTSPDFLDMEQELFHGVKEDLFNIFQDAENGVFKYNYVVLIEAPGSGKSELASIATAYLTTLLLCLRNPQKWLGISHKARIQLINSSASGDQAKRVVFEYIKNKLRDMKFLRELGYEPDENIESELRFPKGIYITPASSTGKTVLGTNLFSVVMDELHEYVKTRERDMAQEMFDKFHKRMLSRFGLLRRYCIILISQARYEDDFIERKFTEWETLPNAYAKRRTHWDARPNLYTQGYTSVEYYDYKERVNKIINIPNELIEEYKADSIVFLRYWASIPSKTIIPFFSDISVVEQIFDKEKKDVFPDNFGEGGGVLPFLPFDAKRMLPAEFKGAPGRNYYIFVDLAKGEKCKVGFCMCYVSGSKTVEWVDQKTGRMMREEKPIINVELIFRFSAPTNSEVDFSEVRSFIEYLRRERGYNIKKVGTDSWQSIDFKQQMSKMGFETEIVRVQGDRAVYQTLKDIINEGRIKCYYRESLFNELKRLEEKDGKALSIYYKDQADALAGAVYIACSDQVSIKAGKVVAQPTVRPVTAPGMFGRSGNVIPLPEAIEKVIKGG